MVNPIFEKVLSMGPLDEEWSISEQSEEHIIFKGAFGHAEVRADGTVISKVGPYVASLEAAIRGEELPVKPKVGRSHENKTIVPSTVRKSQGEALVKPEGGLGITVDDIIRYINPKATEAEAGMFLQWCQRKGFDPLKKQAYLVIYEGAKGRTVNHIVAVDTFSERAEKNGQFDGYQTGIIVKTEDGKIDRREGTFKLDTEVLLGGWCDLYRKDRKFPYKIEVSMKEYDKKRSTWLEIPCTMINKVAICQAHRKAFPSDLGGCYDASEIGINPSNEIVVD